MIAIVFYPLVLGIYYSFTDINQRNMGTPFAPPTYEFVGLQNYIDVLLNVDSVFWKVAGQTAIWTFTNVFFHFTIGLGLALLLNQKFKGREVYKIILLIPWAVPSFVSAFAWRWLYNSEYGFFNLLLHKMSQQSIFEPLFTILGLSPSYNWLSDPKLALASVIVVNIWLGVPFMMVALLGGLQSIPEELYEAADVDGANKWQNFWYITLPMLKPVAFVVTLLGIIWTFNMFNVIFLITEGGPGRHTEILVTYAYREAFMNWNIGIGATYGVIILSFLLVFSVFYTRMLNRTEGGF
ncbi:sugar ABC transporter permease [Caldalkalibacillus thermarum TA2.A1]|nr:sugar ABC transporter permease [Caldalkalibacillus thermarum TA2.A1]